MLRTAGWTFNSNIDDNDNDNNDGDNTHKLVNLPMTLRIVILDVLKVRRLSKSRHVPVEHAQPAMKSREAAANVLDVALEVLYVYGLHQNKVKCTTCGQPKSNNI